MHSKSRFGVANVAKEGAKHFLVVPVVAVVTAPARRLPSVFTFRTDVCKLVLLLI